MDKSKRGCHSRNGVEIYKIVDGGILHVMSKCSKEEYDSWSCTLPQSYVKNNPVCNFCEKRIG